MVDLDGMSILTAATKPDVDMEPLAEIPAETITEIQRDRQVDIHDWENNSATASWGPLMQEVCDLWSSRR